MEYSVSQYRFEDGFCSTLLISISPCNPHRNAEMTNWLSFKPLKCQIISKLWSQRFGLCWHLTTHSAICMIRRNLRALGKALQGCSSFAAFVQTFQDRVVFAYLCPAFLVPFCWHYFCWPFWFPSQSSETPQPKLSCWVRGFLPPLEEQSLQELCLCEDS